MPGLGNPPRRSSLELPGLSSRDAQYGLIIYHEVDIPRRRVEHAHHVTLAKVPGRGRPVLPTWLRSVIDLKLVRARSPVSIEVLSLLPYKGLEFTANAHALGAPFCSQRVPIPNHISRRDFSDAKHWPGRVPAFSENTFHPDCKEEPLPRSAKRLLSDHHTTIGDLARLSPHDRAPVVQQDHPLRQGCGGEGWGASKIPWPRWQEMLLGKDSCCILRQPLLQDNSDLLDESMLVLLHVGR